MNERIRQLAVEAHAVGNTLYPTTVNLLKNSPS